MLSKATFPFCSIHTVILAPDWCADVGKNFDPPAFIEGCQRAHVADIEFYTKNALGHAFFPFRGRPCAGDWATETRELAREAGITFRIYYNVGLDNYMAEARPDWACVDADGTSRTFEKVWRWMCIRSPWREQVLADLCQIYEAIHPDGFWLDLFGTPNTYGRGSFDPADACHCSRCREAYRKRFGQELPKQSDDPTVRRALYEFSKELRAETIRTFLDKLHSLDSNLSLSYNHAGDFWDAMGVRDRKFNALATLHCMEAKPHAAQIFRAKALWSRGKPYEIMTFGSFQRMAPGSASGTWVDWNLIPPAYQEVSGAIASAHGGRFIIGVNLPPDGTVRSGEFENLVRNFAEIEKREAWLSGIESVPNIAVVYDPNSELIARASLPGRSALSEVRGLSEALLDANMHYDIVHAGEFDPLDYRVILCGDLFCPGAGLLRALREFVESGGLLVATNETSLWTADGKRAENFAWAELLGIRYEGESPHKAANYGMLNKEFRDVGEYPILIAAPALHVATTSAVPLAELIHPEAEVTERTFLWSTAYNHPKHSSGKPLITVNRVGKGAAVYIAGPIGKEIEARNDPWLKSVIRDIVINHAKGLAVEVDAPPGVLVILGRKKRERRLHVLSLVNRYGGMVVGTRGRESDHPSVGPIRARVLLSALGRRPGRVLAIDAEGMKWTTTEIHVVIDIDRISHHAVICIE